MKRIVLLGPNSKRHEAMVSLLRNLFPDCEIRHIVAAPRKSGSGSVDDSFVDYQEKERGTEPA